ncbi:MAG: divalent cation tolerance protein CutA [Candidatus Thermoplasmatota archaeon]
MDFDEFKIEVYIPCKYIETLRNELNKAGASKIGRYDHCISVTKVEGHWRPLKKSRPYKGKQGQISKEKECKIETRCKKTFVKSALKAIKKIHPYEEPIINIIPILNHQFQ